MGVVDEISLGNSALEQENLEDSIDQVSWTEADSLILNLILVMLNIE